MTLLTRLRYWWNDQKFAYPFHAHCDKCGAELHAWTNHAAAAAMIAAAWREQHDQCEVNSRG